VLLASLFAISVSRPPPQPIQNPEVPSQSLKFTENKGQWDPKAKFMAQQGGLDMWVTATGITYDWHGQDAEKKPSRDAVSVVFEGATGLGKAKGIHQLPCLNNFYLGKTRATNVRSFEKAVVEDIYKGIDLVTYFDEQEKRPRYDLIVHPGADPDQIRMRYTGAKDFKVTKDGAVAYRTKFGKVEEQRQMAYQKSEVGPDFHFFPTQRMNQDGTVGFDVTGYKKDRTLVIDPLLWATYIGDPTGSSVLASASDAAGNLYVAGRTLGTNFPVTSQDTTGGSGQFSMFVAKFSPTGTNLYCTVYGGSGTDDPTKIKADDAGNAYVVGYTNSGDLPVTNGSVPDPANFQTDFLSKFDGAGGLAYGMYLNDPDDSQRPFPIDLAVRGDHSVTALCVGYDDDIGGPMPVTFQVGSDGTHSGAFRHLDLLSLSPTGLALDADGNAFIAGSIWRSFFPLPSGYQTVDGNANSSNQYDVSCVLIKLNPTLDTLLAGTYLGGIGYFQTFGVAVNSTGEPYVTGQVQDSFDTDIVSGQYLNNTYPTTPGALNLVSISGMPGIFVSHFSNDLTQLKNACLFEQGWINARPILLLDNDCPVLLSFLVPGFPPPLTWDYYSGSYQNSFLARLSPDLSTELYGSCIGRSSQNSFQLAIGGGNYYLTGRAGADNEPTTSNSFESVFNDAIAIGFIEAFTPSTSPGIQRIATDRGATPSVGGGSGKQINVNVYFAEPAGAQISLTAPLNSGVYVNGKALTDSFTVSGLVHVATFAVSADDVSAPTPVTLIASDGTSSLPVTITIQPFVKTLVVRPASLGSNQSFTAYVYPYEAPTTDQTVKFASSPASYLAASAPLTIPAGTSGPTTVTLQTGAFDNSLKGTITAIHATGVSSASTSVAFVGTVVTALGFLSPVVIGDGSTTLGVHFNLPAKQDETYTFTSGMPTLASDVNVFLPMGSTSGVGTVTTNQVFSAASVVQVNYTATISGVKKSVALKVIPNSVSNLFAAGSVVEGDPIPITANLAAPTTASQQFRITTNYPTSVPALSVANAAGSPIISANVPTLNAALTAPRMATLSFQWVNPLGVASGPIKTAAVTIVPLLTSVTLSSLSVKGGLDITGTMNLAEANNTSSPSFTVTSNSPLAFFDSPAVTTGYATSVPFTIHTKPVTKNTTVVISLPTPLGYKTRSFNLVLMP